MKVFFLSILAFWTLNLFAVETKLVTIKTDVADETTVFYLDVHDDGGILGFHSVATAGSGQIVDDVYGKLTEVLDDGFIMKTMDGWEVVRMYLENFDEKNGGKVRLQYLVNGVIGAKNNFYLNLKKSENGFIVADDDGKQVNLMFFKGNWSRILRRWIGVESITTSAK